ncbi:MAG: 23S rRNA (adenine(2503)-C(2))-methyltransferase RlmN [Patescibacteria group bacterium]|jgi:23S rRNA (adenine2503-C2)-methyltransferase
MNLKKLNEVLEGEPKFRQKQTRQMIFKNFISSWQEATNLSLQLREVLDKECPLSIEADFFIGEDKKTVRAIITLEDGAKIESVLLRHKDGRNTVCVSSQAGCPLGCAFCATGRLGFKRNLEPMEIVEQILLFARFVKKSATLTDNVEKPINNVVFMGMGEPFLNYENVLRAIKIINDKEGLNIGARHISVSTVGIIDGIKKIAKEKLQINLAFSLHAPNDALRSRIIPINNKYSLSSVLKEIAEYYKKTKRRVMIEYVMLKNFNDSAQQANELIEVLSVLERSSFFVNLILYNQTENFQASSAEQTKKFKEILEDGGVSVTLRYRFGEDIAAACGQLTGQIADKKDGKD